MSKELEVILQTTDTTKLQERMEKSKYVYDIEVLILEKVRLDCFVNFWLFGPNLIWQHALFSHFERFVKRSINVYLPTYNLYCFRYFL